MGVNNIYFSFLKKVSISGLAGFFLALPILNLLNGISVGVNQVSGSELILMSQSSIIGMGFVFVYGILCAHTYFNGAMSIRSDRKAYLLAIIIFSIIISIIFTISGFIIDILSMQVLELIFSKDFVLETQIPWFFNGNIKNIFTDLSMVEILNALLKDFTNKLAGAGLGLMCGALAYRLKKKYSILLFAGTPLLFILSLTATFNTNPLLAEEILNTIMNVVNYLYMNNSVSLILNLVVAFVSTLVCIRLLIKAPVKEYAFDLFSINNK